jgi:hypothetical protein
LTVFSPYASQPSSAARFLANHAFAAPFGLVLASGDELSGLFILKIYNWAKIGMRVQ